MVNGWLVDWLTGVCAVRRGVGEATPRRHAVPATQKGRETFFFLCVQILGDPGFEISFGWDRWNQTTDARVLVGTVGTRHLRCWGQNTSRI